VFALEFLHAKVHEAVVEVFTPQVGVTSSGFDLENPVFNG